MVFSEMGIPVKGLWVCVCARVSMCVCAHARERACERERDHLLFCGHFAFNGSPLTHLIAHQPFPACFIICCKR